MEDMGVKTIGILNATVRVDNSTEENRRYNIACDVNLSNNAAISVTNGTLTDPDSADSTQFSFRNSNFNTTCYVEGDEETISQKRMDMFEAAEAFVKKAMKFKFEIEINNQQEE